MSNLLNDIVNTNAIRCICSSFRKTEVEKYFVYVLELYKAKNINLVSAHEEVGYAGEQPLPVTNFDIWIRRLKMSPLFISVSCMAKQTFSEFVANPFTEL